MKTKDLTAFPLGRKLFYLEVVMIVRGDTLTELRKLAAGKATKIPAQMIAEMAIPLVEAGLENREVSELERLFRLSDGRA